MGLLCFAAPLSAGCKQASLQIHEPVGATPILEPKAATIPRIIHQSWKTSEVPERFREWQVRFCRNGV